MIDHLFNFTPKQKRIMARAMRTYVARFTTTASGTTSWYFITKPVLDRGRWIAHRINIAGRVQQTKRVIPQWFSLPARMRGKSLAKMRVYMNTWQGLDPQVTVSITTLKPTTLPSGRRKFNLD